MGRRALMGLALALLLLLLLVLGARMVQRRADGGVLPAAGQGAIETIERRRLPDLSGRLLDGRPWSSTSARGSILVINAWASWCAPCRQEQPRLNTVARAYQGRDVRFLGINVNDSKRGATAHVREFAIPYPSLVDANGTIAARLGLFGLPTTIIVDRGGMIGYQLTGVTTVAGLSAQLDRLLAEGGRWTP
jgi:thiol-disulfide isomerase/thioredoxin